MEHTCSICKEEFDSHSKKANHIRWKHKSKEYLENYVENAKKGKLEYDISRLGNFSDFEVTCFNCQKPFNVTERIPKFPSKEKYFCCISCASLRIFSDESKKKMSLTHKEKCNDPIYREKCTKNLDFNHNRCSSKGEREIRNFLKEKYG